MTMGSPTSTLGSVQSYDSSRSAGFGQNGHRDFLPAPPRYKHEEKSMSAKVCSCCSMHGVILVMYYLLGVLYGMVSCKWDLVESVYFSTVTITTVGYGDYTAMNCDGVTGNKIGHQIFMICYILFGLATVCSIIAATAAFANNYRSRNIALQLEGRNGEFDRPPTLGDRVVLARFQRKKIMNGKCGSVVSEMGDGFLVHLDDGTECAVKLDNVDILFEGRARADVEQQYARNSKKELDQARTRWFKVVAMSFLSLAGLVILGAVIYCSIETSWEPIDGAYWAFVTVTTIGYSPTFSANRDIKVFSIFYILCSVTFVGCALAAMGSAWATVKFKEKKVAMLHREIEPEDFTKISEATAVLPGVGSGIDAGEFLAYWLIQEGVVDQQTCFHYLRCFYRLDANDQYRLNHEDLLRLSGRAAEGNQIRNTSYLSDDGPDLQPAVESRAAPGPPQYDAGGGYHNDAWKNAQSSNPAPFGSIDTQLSYNAPQPQAGGWAALPTPGQALQY